MKRMLQTNAEIKITAMQAVYKLSGRLNSRTGENEQIKSRKTKILNNNRNDNIIQSLISLVVTWLRQNTNETAKQADKTRIKQHCFKSC